MRPTPRSHSAAGASLVAVLALLATTACVSTPSAELLAPPRAKKIPHEMTIHGDTRVDPYYWLKEREDSEVIAYLEAENAYAERVLAPIQSTEDTIYDEIVSRIAEDDTSVPVRDGNWVYYSRYEKGKNYAIVCRRPAASVEDIRTAAENATDEQVLLDGNALAEGHDFFSMSSGNVSPDGEQLAFGVDTVGRRFYTLRFKDLNTGEFYPEEIRDVTRNIAWAADNRTVFYAKQDPTTLRTFQIYRHRLGTPAEDDVLVYEEKDETFSCWVGTTKSERFLTISSSQTLASEVRILEADNPEGEFRLFAPRAGHRYSIEHHGDHFYVVSNRDSVNFRLMRTPVNATARDHWEVVIPHREDVLLSGIEVFDSHVVLSERRNALRSLRIFDWSFSNPTKISFPDPVYVAYVGDNPDPSSTHLRYGYSSPVTPTATYEIDLHTGEARMLKQTPVGGGFDGADYISERLWATADDGTRIPISVVRRYNTATDGTAPVLISGYGSYGSSSDPWFSGPSVSLLDRGFICAIAHVRGGSEMGRQWYEDGKLLKKKNTFTDFNDCAHHLIETGYADPDRVYAEGGSAGGLLMGAIMNLEPELYDGILAGVPFVDVVTTMLDDTIPLTTFEYDEWGNPNDETYYHYMLSYSPYDQVRRMDYPNVMVTTGLHDSQVQYWEPAKWVAKLRDYKTDDNVLLLITNMTAGHGGASGRYGRYRETAREFAFLVSLAESKPVTKHLSHAAGADSGPSR